MSHSFVTLAPHEGLIDTDLWIEVQHKLDLNKALKNSGAGTHSWLFGLMKCGHCGYAISVVNKPANMNRHDINYRGHKRGNSICPGRSRVMTLEDIESAVAQELLIFLTRYSEAELQAKQRHSSEANRLEMQIGGLEQEIRRLVLSLGQVTEPDVVYILSLCIHEINGALHRAPLNWILRAYPEMIRTQLTGITSVAKDRKAPSGGKSRTREADDAAIFA